ncbi:succinate dehydrogenase iron-sulfur subunit [Desulfosediminicola flagellatus]|uniref:succinate dehydrogenase iron-sulfur subunit n=1 Tax=Desulfosediminicola flagellatus TaxID=2569541 RepID=UPI0010AB79E1|nr:succinate dehydrogenase iron-sulfur subunit [Desulfosediminicola flagellatus]
MNIILKIQRYNPDTDKAPYFQEYTVEAGPNERLLDALMTVKRFQDGSLGFRKSCAHGVCGSDAMRINGNDGLACKTLIKELAENDGDMITVEPLSHLPVQRDLIVDQDQFFEKYREVKPFLINDEEVDGQERIQSREERMVFDDTTNCILCASCYSACPVLDENPNFLGPAAIAQAFRFNADSRDNGIDERLQILDTPDGVWSCDNHFKCTKACPRSILITKRINQTKKVIKDKRGE